MAARCWRRVALVAGVLGLLGSAQSCTEDGVSLHVICPIHPTVDDGECTWEPDGETCVAEGVMNLATTKHYTMFLRAESGLKARMRDVPPQGESSGIQVREAEVELRLPSGERFLDFGQINDPTDPSGQREIVLANPYTVVATGYIQPEGLGAVGLTIIDNDRGNFFFTGVGQNPLVPLIVASIKVKGVTNGAQEIEGGEYLWPIRLSNSDACAAEIEGCANMVGQDDFALLCGS